MMLSRAASMSVGSCCVCGPCCLLFVEADCIRDCRRLGSATADSRLARSTSVGVIVDEVRFFASTASRASRSARRSATAAEAARTCARGSESGRLARRFLAQLAEPVGFVISSLRQIASASSGRRRADSLLAHRLVRLSPGEVASSAAAKCQPHPRRLGMREPYSSWRPEIAEGCVAGGDSDRQLEPSTRPCRPPGDGYLGLRPRMAAYVALDLLAALMPASTGIARTTSRMLSR